MNGVVATLFYRSSGSRSAVGFSHQSISPVRSAAALVATSGCTCHSTRSKCTTLGPDVKLGSPCDLFLAGGGATDQHRRRARNSRAGWIPRRLDGARSSIMLNPGFSLYTRLETENSLADAIATLDRYMKARSVNSRYNRVCGHADIS